MNDAGGSVMTLPKQTSAYSPILYFYIYFYTLLLYSLLLYSPFIPPNTSTLTVSTTTQHISLWVGLDIHGHNNGGLIFADPLTLHGAPHEVEILDFVWNLMNYHEILLWGLIVLSLLILHFATPPWEQNWICPTLFDDQDSVELSVCSYMGNFSMLTC